MSSYVLYLPEARGQAVQEVAQAAQTSLDNLVLAAIADKIAAARTAQYFHTVAARRRPPRQHSVLSQHGAGAQQAGAVRAFPLSPSAPARAERRRRGGEGSRERG